MRLRSFLKTSQKMPVKQKFKKLKSNSTKIFLLLSAFVFTGCGSTQVPIVDGEWCALIGKYGATCNFTFHNEPRDIQKPNVDTELFGWLATRAENFAAWKTELEQLCVISGACNLVVKKKIREIWSQFNSILAAKDRICEGKRDCGQLKFSENRYINVEVENGGIFK